MAKFVALVDYTEQGIRTIQDSPERAEAFAARARQAGVTVEQVFWTSGAHDGVLILDAPDDETVAGLMLALARTGNVRTQTLRAYGRDEMKRILAGSE